MEDANKESGLRTEPDGCPRCFWHGGLDDYVRYHDEEWGWPTADDQRLFEKICLEGFQSGLSWLTILRKRDEFRRVFAQFDFHKVAEFGDAEIETALANKGIVRHRGKITSTINNAKRALEIVDEFGSLAAYIWQFEPAPDARPDAVDYATLRQMTQSPESVRLSKDLKKRGWSFVGPTTMYAFMQSLGMVNDHIEGCIMRGPCEDARRAFVRPR